MKLYHFCAMRQGLEAGVLAYTDGTIRSAADLGDEAQYTSLKREITKIMDMTDKGTSAVVLLSLTLIGDVKPNK